MSRAVRVRSQGRVLAAAIAGASGGMLVPLLTGTLAARLQAEFGLGARELGLVLGTFFVVSGLLSTSGGRLADRVGWATALRVGAIGSAVAMLFVAGVADGVPTLVAGLVLGGASLALSMPSSSLAITEELPTSRRGLLFGVKQTAVPLAGLLAGLAVPAIALTVGWRWAYAAGALVPLAAVLLVPSGVARPPAPDPHAPPAGRLPGIFAVLSIGGSMAAVAVSGLSTFLVISAVDAGIAEGTAGVLAAAASLTGMAMRVTSGHLADRRGSGGFVPTAGMMVAGLAGFGLLAVHTPLATVVGALVAYGLGWGWPGLFYFGAVVHFPRRPGVATGAVQAGVSAGSAVGPLVFGMVVDAAGYRAAWGTAAAAMLLGAGLVAVGARRVVRPGAQPVWPTDR